jgi:hypothetical protein
MKRPTPLVSALCLWRYLAVSVLRKFGLGGYVFVGEGEYFVEDCDALEYVVG